MQIVNVKDKFIVACLIFVFVSFLLFWRFGFGSISYRNLCGFIILALILFNLKGLKLFRIAKFYLIYLFFYIITSIINGYVSTIEFKYSLLIYHGFCILLILALPILLNNKNRMNFFVVGITIFYILNCILTILQYNDNTFAWSIPLSIDPHGVALNKSIDKMISLENAKGFSLACGFFTSAVTNGYFLSSFLPIALSCFYNINKYKYVLIPFLFLFSGFAIYCNQQRAAFICFIFILMFYLYYKISRQLFYIFIFFIIFILFFNFIQIGDLGRITDKNDNEDRFLLLNDFIIFFNSESVIFGGNHIYASIGGNVQHNTFLDSIIKDGIMGFIPFIIFFSKVLIFSLNILFRHRIHKDLTVMSALGCLMYLFYSQTHSQGLQTGTVDVWFIIIIMHISLKKI